MVRPALPESLPFYGALLVLATLYLAVENQTINGNGSSVAQRMASLRSPEDYQYPATDASSDLPTNFQGIQARAFPKWEHPVPCFPVDNNWKARHVQNRPSDTGLLFVKPFKTGSSTCSGVNLRIARNLAQRHNMTDICQTRFDHGPDFTPAHSLFGKRRPLDSILWSVVRDPTKRAISQFFFFRVSRLKEEPTDANFISFLTNGRFPHHNYYLRTLYTPTKYEPSQNHPVATANHILNDYNFVGVTERINESLVALMMLLDLPMADFLYLSAKRGGYDDGRSQTIGCKYIWKSFVSPGMQEFLASEQWQNMTYYDNLFYHAVNRSLDLTIDALGRDKFAAQLHRFERAQERAREVCLPTAVFPCDAAGKFYDEDETDCLWNDSGCGTTCLDQVATEMGLWVA